MPKISADHSCTKTKCKGQTLGELFVDCNRCGRRWFMECLQEEDEIYELLKAIGLIRLELNERSEAKTITSVTEDKKNIFNTIIGKDSPIEYVCLQCKKREGSTRTKIKKLETLVVSMNDLKKEQESEISKYKQIICEYEQTKKTMEGEIETHKLRIHENQETINALTQTIEQKDTLIEQNKASGTTMAMSEDDDDEDDDRYTDEHGQLDIKK